MYKRQSLDSPWYEKVGQHQFEFSSVTLFTTLTVKVEKIKPRDGTVLTRFYIDNTPVSYTHLISTKGNHKVSVKFDTKGTDSVLDDEIVEIKEAN